jgi:hypothetical protein
MNYTLNDDIYNLMYSSSPKLKESALSKIKHINSLSSNIDSIFIYNKSDNSFYSSLDANLQTNYDDVMRNLLVNTKETFSSNFIPNKIKLTSKKGNVITKNNFSIILSNVSLPNNYSTDGAIILNLNADTLGKYFKTKL